MEAKQFPKSDAALEAGKKFIPGGVIGTRRPENLIKGVYPLYAREGKGSHFFDIDGNEYIDFLAGYGPVLLGHAYQAVDDAAIARIRKGFCFNLSQDIQNALAEKVVSIIPCAEQVFFVLSGSDATTAAVRLARTYTKRDKILRCGYNGWHDWSVPVPAGVPAGARQDVTLFTYNDIQSVRDLMEKYRGQVAAILVTPLGHEINHPVEFPKDGFLQELRNLTKAEGTILIFDEIRTGFRLAAGGAQEYFGVTPDITTFGKAVANGYPIGGVAGKKEVMLANQEAYISSTFFYNSFPMAAALATIHEIETKGVIPHIWRLGEMLQIGIKALLKEYKIPAEVSGPPPMPFLTFSTDPEKKHRERRNIFFNVTTSNGVFLHPWHHWYILFTHTEDDIKTTLKVIEKAMQTIVENVR